MSYKRPSFSISCRNVGPGGTDVFFYPTEDGLKCVWENENCPYQFDGVTIDENHEASDGHNVSLIPWSKLEEVMALRAKGKKF